MFGTTGGTRGMTVLLTPLSTNDRVAKVAARVLVSTSVKGERSELNKIKVFQNQAGSQLVI